MFLLIAEVVRDLVACAGLVIDNNVEVVDVSETVDILKFLVRAREKHPNALDPTLTVIG
jgi:hypothetical protein